MQQSKFGYIPKNERKKILLLADDIRMHSGIGTMGREIVIGTAHRFNWVNLGGGMKHPDAGKILDISEDVNKLAGVTDSDVKVIPNNGYGNQEQVRALIARENPDAIFIFTDPRYWTWLFDIEREIRSKIPIVYLNIWDDLPIPLYNTSFYDSCDTLMAISKQTKNINEMVLGEKAKNKIITYVPHGIDSEVFHPIVEKQEKVELQKIREPLFGEDEIEFVVLWNSRNIRRKQPGDVILSYRRFCDLIGKEKAKKCALVMHTQPIDGNGTDLFAVREAICDPSYVKVYFSTEKLSSTQMNQLYNIADVTMLISSNEGWGLSLTESMMAGTPIIGNVTGGMQDQMRFEDEKGKWLELTPDFPSNNFGKYKSHGPWVKPVFPTSRSLVGSPATPYIYEDRCEPLDVAYAIKYWYDKTPEERKEAGRLAREWVTGDEAQMSARKMCDNIINSLEQTFEKFVPRPRYEVIKTDSVKPRYIDKSVIYE